LLLSISAIGIIDKAYSAGFVSGPRQKVVYSWVRYPGTQTIAYKTPTSAKPLYLQYIVKPNIGATVDATHTVKTSISVSISFKVSVTTSAEATVKDGIVKSTAKTEGSLSISTSAKVTTTHERSDTIEINQDSNSYAKFTAENYMLYVTITAIHYYLHKYVWDWHTNSWYDTGRTTEQKPYHKVIFDYTIEDIEDLGLGAGSVSQEAINTAPSKWKPVFEDAMDIYQDIAQNKLNSRYIAYYEYRPYVTDGYRFSIKDGVEGSYSASVSLTLTASLGEGFEAAGNKVEFTLKYSTSTSVEVDKDASIENITGAKIESNGDINIFNVYFCTLIWNGCWLYQDVGST